MCTGVWSVRCCTSYVYVFSSLEGATLHHSAPLEMLFRMVSFFAKIASFDFWPKTMDYSKAF